MLEERVARLEETLYFQERLVNDLSTALAAQQRQIDVVERAMEEVRAHVEELRLLLEEGGGVNAPPPHYQM